jgi:hypothetical protein
MAEHLEELCGNISLSEGEKTGITITEGEIEEVRAQGGRCLIGRIWTAKRVNKEAFKVVLTRVWRTVKGVRFKELDDNIWLFEFEEVDDMRRVLDGRPWSFDRQLIVLTEFDGKTPPAQMAFKHSLFWVQVHDLPLLCMTKRIAVKIGESLGKLTEVDLAGDGAGWGRSIRIRVEIDLAKPLERGRALRLEGKSYWVSFKYEKLPMFFFGCGRLVHDAKGCPTPRQTRLSATDDLKQWGVGLRADDGRRRGAGGGYGYFNNEGWKPKQAAVLGAEGGGSGADGSEQRAASTSEESSAFSGPTRNLSKQLPGAVHGPSDHRDPVYNGAVCGAPNRGETLAHNVELKLSNAAGRGLPDRGESYPPHAEVYGAVRGLLARGGGAVFSPAHGDKRDNEHEPALEELVEQLSFTTGEHVAGHIDDVGLWRDSIVIAEFDKEKIT